MRPSTSRKPRGTRSAAEPSSPDARITHTRTLTRVKPRQNRDASGTAVPRWSRSRGSANTPYETYDFREATRAHGRSFLGTFRTRLSYLIRTRREEGIAYTIFDLLMHLPIALIGITLFLVMARYLRTVHDGGYAVGALAFAYTLKVATTPLLKRYCGVRVLLGVSAALQIPAVFYLMYLSNMLEPILEAQTAQVTTLEYAVACMLVGYTLPPWSVLMLEAQYRSPQESDTERLFSKVAWTNLEKIALYPLAACLIIFFNTLMGINTGFWMAILLAGMLVFVVIFIPGLLPQNPDLADTKSSPTRKVSEPDSVSSANPKTVVPADAADSDNPWSVQKTAAQEVPSDAMNIVLVLGLMILSGCIGSIGAALLGFAIKDQIVSLYPLMIVICLGVASIATIPALLGTDRVTTWHGWLISGVLLTLASLLPPTAQTIREMLLELAVYGLTLGIALGSQKFALVQVLVRKPDPYMSFYMSGAMALGLTFGATWGGYLGDGAYYRNAFLVPIIASCLYFCMGHFYGYLYRRRYEEQLAPLEKD